MSGSRDREPAAEAREAGAPESWALRLRRGDSSAVQEVRGRIGRILELGALSIPAQEREDLEQAVMTEVWQAINRSGFDFSGGFWGFVEVVTSRRCIDWLRSRRQTSPLGEDLRHTGKGPLKQALEKERAGLAASVLAALDPGCRELLILRFRENLSYAEIAGALGKTEVALRVQLYRCIRYARRILAATPKAQEVRPLEETGRS